MLLDLILPIISLHFDQETFPNNPKENSVLITLLTKIPDIVIYPPGMISSNLKDAEAHVIFNGCMVCRGDALGNDTARLYRIDDGIHP